MAEGTKLGDDVVRMLRSVGTCCCWRRVWATRKATNILMLELNGHSIVFTNTTLVAMAIVSAFRRSISCENRLMSFTGSSHV